MTLQKFSDKSFSSMFKNRLKSAVFFPIVGMIILGFYAVAMPFSEVVRFNNPEMYGGGYEYISIENVKYVLFDQISTIDTYFPDVAVIMYVAVILAAILSAIMVFRDLSNKKTANVYYSLGFSRTKLFASTYLAGATSVIGMVVIPFALSFIINAFAFGISKEFISACIFTVSVLCNVSLIAYTLSVIAMTLSGMLVEGVFFSFFLNAISPIFTFSACMFSDGLLTGGGFVDANDYYYGTFENSFMSAFIGKLSFMNGLSHSAFEVNKLGSCLYTTDIENLEGFLSAEDWATPNFIPLLVWSFILTGLVFLSLCIFNRKKAENIGFFASSPILYRIFFGTLIVGFSSLGCSRGRAITKGLTWLYVLIILAICLVITAILTLILVKLSRMKFRKEVKVFGIYSLAVVLFAFVFSTGFFGYTNRLPAVEKVKEVTITGFSAEDYGYYNSQIYDIYAEYTPITMGNFSTYETYSFTSKADITNIEELHKGLIAADNIKMSQNYRETKIGVKINIVYTLKNGKTLSRSYYRITPELIDKYLTYNGISEKAKLELTEKLHMAITALEDDDEYYKDYVLKEFFTVFSNDLTSAHNVDLTTEQLYDLLAAYTMDVENLSAKELLAPKGKALGGIAIREDFCVYASSYNEETDEPVVEGLGSELEYSSLTNANLSNYDSNTFLTINENMVNTIKWAKEVGIYKYFAKDYETGIHTVEATHNNSSFIKLSISDNHNYNLMFSATSLRDGNKSINGYYYSEDTEHVYNMPLVGSHYVNGLTKDEINYLRDNAHPYYLTTETGYFLRLSTDEKESLHTIVFVPDSKLTPELKIKLAENNETATEDVTSVGVEHTTYIE